MAGSAKKSGRLSALTVKFEPVTKFSPVMSMSRSCIAFFCLLSAVRLSAQLDTIHWLPPMHARDEWGPQYLYLSTPVTTAFDVHIRDGAGALLTTVTISNGQPYRYNIGASENTAVMVPPTALHKAIPARGLVIDGEKPFYACFRTHAYSSYHAGDLTCKGRAALGRTFRIAHLLQETDGGERRSNFIGVLATEDSTFVQLSDFDSGVDFRIDGADVPSDGETSIWLQRGQGVVFSQYIDANSGIQPPIGLFGALLTATKPVAVNCGSWVGAPVVFQANDIGIDQIAPFEQMGEEYILCKGNGSAILEHPILVAHKDNTQIWLNDDASPVAVLDGGDFFVVGTSEYSAAGNLYIRSSEPIFVYQMIGGTAIGDDAMRTAGLIFVPPISCGIPNAVNNIFEPNRVGSMRFEGGLMITAMRDSLVTVRVDNAIVSVGAPGTVPGNPDFVTYRDLDLFDQTDSPNRLSVVAEGAVQVALFGRNEPASFAAFYSGFTKTDRPSIEVSRVGDGVCPDTLVATGRFDGVQWIFEDSVLQYGPDTFLVVYTPGDYVATGYLGVCRRTDYAADTIAAMFNSPEFPWAVEQPSCYGFSDGKIAFGSPQGGLAPYHYSIDGGQNYTLDANADGLTAGNYRLVVRDSTGCYNRPLHVTIGQPDSFSVDLTIRRLREPVYPGDLVELEGVPGRPVVSTVWEPVDSSGCLACLDYAFHPDESVWVVLTVFDSMGCPASDRLLVNVEPNVFAPNAIRPESSFDNDRFTLFSREPVQILRLSVYDRWGELVFEQKDFFTNDRALGWDGRFRGEPAPPGVYVFGAEVQTPSGRIVTFRGDLLVLR